MNATPSAQPLPAPEQQAVIDTYPLCASLTPGIEYTFTQRSRLRVHRHLQHDTAQTAA